MSARCRILVRHNECVVGSERHDEQLQQKWLEMSDIVDRLPLRVGDPHDFSVQSRSSLAGDDRDSYLFEVSQGLAQICRVDRPFRGVVAQELAARLTH
jgi:hypothetical protein